MTCVIRHNLLIHMVQFGEVQGEDGKDISMELLQEYQDLYEVMMKEQVAGGEYYGSVYGDGGGAGQFVLSE